jgi:hypothetical protein
VSSEIYEYGHVLYTGYFNPNKIHFCSILLKLYACKSHLDESFQSSFHIQSHCSSDSYTDVFSYGSISRMIVIVSYRSPVMKISLSY